ncbi:hypothetical protein C8Q78DRAFT_972876 [Trametes maxima]|nr:hypothetical protein C8Q78DRAFT_972876 [Trametes maxima]
METVRLISPGRPTAEPPEDEAGIPSPDPTTQSTRHPSLTPFEELPGDGIILSSANSGLPQARSPVPNEHDFGAKSPLPSASIPYPGTSSAIPHRPRSPPAVETGTGTTLTSRSLDMSQRHELVTNTTSPHLTVAPPSRPQDSREATMQDQQDVHDVVHQQRVPTEVPAVWSAKEGSRLPGIQTVTFFVDDATAEATFEWARRKETFSFKRKHVKVHLLCLPLASVEQCNETLSPNATREDIVAAMWNIKTEWPLRGTLVVQADGDCAGNPWIPDQDSGPLDITHAIVRGMNTLRLIQLADMSSKLFVLHAAEPSEAERRAVGSETIAWLRTRASLAPQSPKL